MLNDLLIHPKTRRQLENFLKDPTHALIITGSEGSGKKHLIEVLATTLLGVKDIEALHKYPYYLATNPKDPTITIEHIRALKNVLTLRTPTRSETSIKRVLTIIDAERMGTEAQNAFLKSLEEPPKDTCIILSVQSISGLLPTIYSRAVTVDVLPVSEEMAKEYFRHHGYPSALLASSYALSQGQVGLLTSLLTNAEHPLKTYVDMAKESMRKSIPERLELVDALSKEKDAIALLLNTSARITHAALYSAAKSNNSAAVQRWSKSSELVSDTQKALKQNANTKLLLDNFFMNI